MYKLILLFLAVFLVHLAPAQSWRLHLNGNETFFSGNDLLGQYPILWYSGDDDRGVLVGGFGGGVSYTTVSLGAYHFKYQINVQRSRFYDHPVIFNNVNGELLGAFIGINTNLNATAFAMPQLVIGNRWTAGLGIGTRYTIRSVSDFGETLVEGEKIKLKERNRAQAPQVLFLPLELGGSFGRFSAAARLEAGITRSSRLDALRKERAHLFFVEAGYRLGD